MTSRWDLLQNDSVVETVALLIDHQYIYTIVILTEIT